MRYVGKHEPQKTGCQLTTFTKFIIALTLILIWLSVMAVILPTPPK